MAAAAWAGNRVHGLLKQGFRRFALPSRLGSRAAAAPLPACGIDAVLPGYAASVAAGAVAAAAMVQNLPASLGRTAWSPPACCEETAAHSGAEVVEEIPSEVRVKDSIVRLYQYESCPFCRKVRSCLDYNRIPYEIIEVHPLKKSETKEIAPDYKKVPILRIDTANGRHLQLRDSKTIVRELLGADNPGVGLAVPPPCATPSTGKMWSAEHAVGTVEEQWVRWTDVVLVQCIVLNVYRTMRESAETFSYLLTHPSFPWLAQRSAAFSGTVVMWAVSKSRKRKFGVADEREALYEAVQFFAGAVKTGGGPFLGGAKPGAVDFNVYGILRSAEGCQTERDLFACCADILPWYDAMKEVVGPSCASNVEAVQRGPSKHV